MAGRNQFHKTKKFKFYELEITLLKILAVITLILIITTQWNTVNNPEYSTSTESSFLTNFIGKKRDTSNMIWNNFRSNIPILIAVVLAGWIIYKKILNLSLQNQWILGLIFVTILYRADIFIYFPYIGLWYLYTEKANQWRFFVPSCWVIAIVTLWYCEYTNHFKDISDFLARVTGFTGLHICCGQTLNMNMLRLLAFAIDRKRGSQSKELEKHLVTCEECTQTEHCLRGRNHFTPEDYSWLSFLSFMTFAPTFLAGPPLSYNNFMSFRKMPSSKKPRILNWVLILAGFELYHHYFPSVNINLSMSMMTAQTAVLFRVIFSWWHMLIIFRFHKLWAQLMGVEVIDNFDNCVFRSRTIQQFWQDWHRGFNVWLIRYMYIPLGGKKNVFSVIVVFFFVAYWHHHSSSIFILAGGIILFYLAEILLQKVVEVYLPSLYDTYWFKYLCSMGGACIAYPLILLGAAAFGLDFSEMANYWTKMKEEWLVVLSSFTVFSGIILFSHYWQQSRKAKLRTIQPI